MRRATARFFFIDIYIMRYISIFALVFSIGCSSADGSESEIYVDKLLSSFSVNIDYPIVTEMQIAGNLPTCGEIRAKSPKILVDFEQPKGSGGTIVMQVEKCSGAIPYGSVGYWSYGDELDFATRKDIRVARSPGGGEFDCSINWELQNPSGPIGLISDWLLMWEIPCENNLAFNRN
jgi:hypothetical protein